MNDTTTIPATNPCDETTIITQYVANTIQITQDDTKVLQGTQHNPLAAATYNANKLEFLPWHWQIT